MKKYNVENYVRYKEDLKLSMPEGLFWDEYTRDELIIKFMYLVENSSKKIFNYTTSLWGYDYK